MDQWLVLIAAMLAAGCVAGVLAGLFGIGGGIVVVPVLEYILGLLDHPDGGEIVAGKGAKKFESGARGE